MLIDSANYSGGFFSNIFRRWPWSKDTGANRIYESQIFDSNTPVLVDKDNLAIPLQDCPHLQIAIGKKCDMFANGMWKCVHADDVEKENPREFPQDDGLALLKKPNPLQSREDFLWQYMLYKEGWANNFIYGNRGSALVKPAALWHLPSDLMKIRLTGKMFDQTTLEGIIKDFLLCEGRYEKPYQVKDVLYHATNFNFKKGAGQSKIPGLQYPISNIMASLKTRNIISTKKGMIGILSNEGKTTTGSVMPILDPERQRIEKQFNQDRGLYGDRENIIITQAALRWNPTSFPIRDLMIHESDEMDFQTICDSIDIDRRCFSGTKDATFENKNQAIKGTYENSIQPCADSLAGMMTAYLAEPGRAYILTYDWLAIMKADQKAEAEADKIKTDRRAVLYENGLISAEAWAEMENVKLTGDGVSRKNPRQINIP